MYTGSPVSFVCSAAKAFHLNSGANEPLETVRVSGDEVLLGHGCDGGILVGHGLGPVAVRGVLNARDLRGLMLRLKALHRSR